ncbi:MAG: polysaccharide deacetylase family protein [Akkermansia sp.]|nr:polysaccharide deacetylase family protein [Akkermansia sp.]MBQ9095628.1 polysaccharide deacetylase family protein [Akkermansia sp.]
MKRFIPVLISLVLAACSTQQQQKDVTPDVPLTPEEQPTTPGQTEPQVKPVGPDKPFKPSMPGMRVSSVSVPGKYVAITFDDGPSSSLTPQVLDILKRHGASATFFVLGDNASRNPSILARAVAEGHEIGNHTYSHIKMTSASAETIRSEISRTAAVIESATGRKAKVMRPPYGATNANIVSNMFNNYGMRSILWNIDTQDWRHPGVGVVVQRAVGGAKPGSIILLHDIHSSTLAAVEGIVTGLQARGYKLVTVSQLIEMGRQAAQQPAAPAAEPTTPAVPTLAPGAAGAATISGTASL